MIGIYARVSSLQQKDNYSLSIQKTRGIAFAQSLGEDYTIYEEAESGASMIARTELERLLQDIQNGIITKVWAIELTRFSRSVEDFQIIKRTFVKYNVELFINNIKTDLSQADHRFLFNIDAAVSEYERERIIERVKRSIDERKDRGMLHIQKCLGYDLQYDENGASTYVINKSEAKIVRMIFKKYRDGLSHNKIANYLNDNQYKTKLGNRWTRRGVLNILQHFIYTGHTNSANGRIVKSKLYPSIISLDDYKEFWANYRRGAKNPNPPYRRYQSSGIISCPVCGAKWMHRAREIKGKRYEYYKADHLSRCSNSGKWVLKGYIDDALDRALFLAFMRTDEAKGLYETRRQELYKESEGSRKVAERYQEEYEKLEKSQNRITDAITRKILTSQDAKQTLDMISRKKNEIEQRLNEIEKEYEILKDTDDAINLFAIQQLQGYIESPEQKKKKFLKEVIQKATILNGKLTVIFTSGTKITLNMDTYKKKVLKRLGPASELYETLKTN